MCRLRSRGAQAVALQHVGSQFSDLGSILWPLSCKADSSPLGKSLACDFRQEGKPKSLALISGSAADLLCDLRRGFLPLGASVSLSSKGDSWKHLHHRVIRRSENKVVQNLS